MPEELMPPRVFVCTVLDRRRSPITGEDGAEWTSEVVAETAGKARYSFWLAVRECWEDIKITDIRVRVAGRERVPRIAPGWQSRMSAANKAIRLIGSHGRRFLSSNSDRNPPSDVVHFAEFFVDPRGELWYRDWYKLTPVLVRHDNRWPGFSDGGTLRGVVEELRDFIMTGQMPCVVVRDYWGYGGEAAEAVNAGLRHMFSPIEVPGDTQG